ncbi:MAG: C-type lectin domain-containing protein [Sandaracinaceae bacterium]
MTSRSGLRLLIASALLLAGCALERSGLAPADGATPPFDAEIGRDGQVIDGQVIDDDAGRDSGVDGCTPGPELCNGVDDDCDPATPDGADEATLGATCDGDDVDLCEEGVIACVDGSLVCEDDGDQPDEVELCNGLDDDCDPSTADGASEPTLGAACDGDDVDLCTDGAQVCDAGTLRCEDAPEPAPDLCNGVDDDCNPATVDGSGDPGVGVACDGADADLCQEGTTSCISGAIVCGDTTGDALELCNGMDDDCNPATADGADDPGVGAMCDGPDADLCNEGTRSCVGGALVCSDATGDTADLCNGIDDDCNPATADGADDPGVGVRCDGSDADMCLEGASTCGGGVITCGDMTGDSVETCDGTDEDCDGAIDEGAGCPCTRVGRGGRSYLFCGTGGDRLSFLDAAGFCAAEGYSMVKIETAAENAFIAAEMAAISAGNDWWIGLSDYMSAVWYWAADLTAATYTNWRPGQPNDSGDCAEMDPSETVMGTLGSWNDVPCDETKRFVCEAGP